MEQEEVSGKLPRGQVVWGPGPAGQTGSLEASLYIAMQKSNDKNSRKRLG